MLFFMINQISQGHPPKIGSQPTPLLQPPATPDNCRKLYFSRSKAKGRSEAPPQAGWMNPATTPDPTGWSEYEQKLSVSWSG